MKTYFYAIEYYNNNQVMRIGYNTEKEMKAGAITLDNKGFMLKDAIRETWKRKGNIYTLIKLEGYSMGKPTRLIWEKA